MKTFAKSFGILLALISLAVSAPVHAITITGVEVDIGTTVFTNWNGNGANHLGASGTSITAGQNLILTQNPTTPSDFNFDTSDVKCAGSVATCTAPVIKVTTVERGTVVFVDGTPTSNVLHDNNTDPVNGSHTEAHAWTLLGSLSGVKLWVGYADDTHTDPCTDAAEGAGTAGNCHPDPWQGTFDTIFLGSPVTSGCLRPGSTSCFDAGALRIQFDSTTFIQATPEPVSILLLGFGLAGLAAFRRYRASR